MITEMSRRKLRFTYKNDSYSAEGELVLPDDDLYKRSIKNEILDEALTEEEIDHIRQSLYREFNNTGRKLTVEE